jgi:proline racemase
VAHPENPEIDRIAFTQFAGPVEMVDGVKTGRNAVVISPGKIDRSPCGTGTSARLAVMHAKGEIGEGEPYVSLSPLGSRFDARIEAVTSIAGVPAIRPSIEGRAWITGFHTYVLDPRDPWPQGYTVSDTWYRTLD